MTFLSGKFKKVKESRAKPTFSPKVSGFLALFFEFPATKIKTKVMKPSKNLRTVNLQLYLGL